MSLKKWVGAVVVAVFLLSGSTTATAVVLLDRVVAVVNTEVITWGDLYKAMEFKASDEFKALGDDEKRKLFKENEASFLEVMIDTKLQIQAAKKLNIDASKDEVTDAMEGIKKKYSLGEKEFSESLEKEGLTLEEYRKILTEQIILSKVVGQEVRNKIIVSDGDVKEYMLANKESGYKISEILFKKPKTDAERKALEVKAGDIYQRLKAGEDFSALAGLYSEDSTGKKGGDLGFVNKEYLGKEFLEVISRMKVGDLSEPFWTAKGLYIIKLEDSADAKTADELKELTKKKLFEKRFTEAYKNWIKGLREKSYVEVRL
ncbi:MAG: peptidylprolyl isomerase [Thermodesulfovibrionales bacterium]|jgi:peptidyl-prolyl cis-trans isomerase SurA